MIEVSPMNTSLTIHIEYLKIIRLQINNLQISVFPEFKIDIEHTGKSIQITAMSKLFLKSL